MYIGLRAKMIERGISISAIAELLNAHRNTVSNKLDGIGDFKVDEFVKIKNAFFPDVPFEELVRKAA